MDANTLILSMLMTTFPILLIFAVWAYCGPASLSDPAPVSASAVRSAAVPAALRSIPVEPAPPAGEYPEIREAENFHGFRTVHFYESECRRAGQEIRRIPCRAADGATCVVLVNSVQGDFDGIDIITADEQHCLYSGSVRHGEGFLEKLLAQQGFSLVEQAGEPASVGASSARPQPTSDIPVTPKLYEEIVGEFTQYSLFA